MIAGAAWDFGGAWPAYALGFAWGGALTLADVIFGSHRAILSSSDSSGKVGRELRSREQLLDHPVRVVVDRAFDGISLHDLRLTPMPNEPHQATPILAA
jgi:hypothetical protein